jgi:uncharacterized protein YndB with AHSA1/START domain
MSRERAIDLAVDIAASREEVWNALVDPVELVRWFSLSAEVTPGLGGQTTWAWDDGWRWISTIERWEPGHALTLLNRDQRPFDTGGQLLPEGQVAPATLAMEFTLATVDGGTRLRLVHSGFGRGTHWDDELDGVSAGWTFELRSLKLYLERFRGLDRAAGMARVDTPLGQADVWRRLLGPAGFTIEPWPAAAGARCRVKSAAGLDLEGEVYLHLPERDLSFLVPSLGGGVLRLGTHQAMGKTGVTVWLASYRGDPGAVAALEADCQRLLEGLFQAAEAAG